MLFGKNHIFGGEMCVAAAVVPKGLGPQDSTKKLAHCVPFGSTVISKPCFQKWPRNLQKVAKSAISQFATVRHILALIFFGDILS